MRPPLIVTETESEAPAPDALAEVQARARAAENARERAERSAARMRFLAEAGKTLATSLDYATTLRSVATLAVPAIADWCVVDLVTDAGLERLAVAHADPDRVRLVEELRTRFPEDPSSKHGVHEVVRTGAPILVREIAPDLIASAARDAAHLRVLESLDLGSYIIAPLCGRDRILGAMTLVAERARSPYDEEDLQLVEGLASRAALAIENARLVANLETTQQHLEHTAAELEAQAEEMQATVEELEVATNDLTLANEQLEIARQDAERARAAAEEANAVKSQFLATMSHELRTPLNAIDGYAELMEMGIHGPLTDGQRVSLQRMRRAQKRLLALINDILNFAKLEAGQVQFECREVGVSSLTDDIEAVIAPQVAARGQVLVIDAVDPALTVYADAERAEQILLNLLANAVKFTPEGGHIELRAEEAGERVRLIVRDTGPGIAPERHDRIFEPFVQAVTGLGREAGGVGLGLAISRDLARAMAGDLVVESAPGHGSVFILTLPRHAPPG